MYAVCNCHASGCCQIELGSSYLIWVPCRCNCSVINRGVNIANTRQVGVYRLYIWALTDWWTSVKRLYLIYFVLLDTALCLGGPNKHQITTHLARWKMSLSKRSKFGSGSLLMVSCKECIISLWVGISTVRKNSPYRSKVSSDSGISRKNDLTTWQTTRML